MEDDDTTGPAGQVNNFDNQEANMPPLPLYKATVTEAIKRGENIMFTINASKAAEESGCVVLRQHEDIEWLHHNLVTGNATEGVIIPPLPVKPLSDPKSAESMSRKHLGDNTKVMRGDQFEGDCKAVQKYLELMLSHSTFGRDKNLEKFLTEEEAPVRARLNKGLISRLGSAIDSARKANRKDVDDYFQDQRNFANEFSKAVKDASLNYNKLIVAQWRLSSSYRNLATDFTTCTAEMRDEPLIKVNKLMKLVSEGCEDEAGSLELRSGQSELTLGFFLELYARYSDALKDMHFRRTSALVDYESCEKALEKAKPAKKAAAEEAYNTAKKIFETSSEQAKKEIKSFTQQRLLSSAEALTAYAELQMKISQDFYSQLFHTRKHVLELRL
ncbi:sorting nexin-5 [Aplysia californica]|uniref:Sorting nexin-5 n=1 Tax=Aplysia californica TaxID=6500 RepID=A0ABM1AB58_APLCA|nr:sorting nexin-5 [Aplysia californica]